MREFRPLQLSTTGLPFPARLVLLVPILLLLLLSPPRSSAHELVDGEDTWHVLLIYSLNRASAWDEGYRRGILDGIANHLDDIHFLEESIDALNRSDPAYLAATERYLSEKYRDMGVDVVVALGAMGVEFAQRYPDFLPDADRIFVNTVTPDGRSGVSNASGDALHLIADFSPERSFAAAYQLPGINHVTVIGSTEPGLQGGFLEEYRQAAENAENADGITSEIMINERWPVVLDHVASLGPGATVLFTVVPWDNKNQDPSEHHWLKDVLEVSKVPVLVPWEFYLGSGALGGFANSSEVAGQALGKAIVDALANGLPDTRLEHVVGARYIYDWRALKRHGISLAALPEEAEILFQPPSVWEQYSGYILLTAALVATLILLLAGSTMTAVAIGRSRDKLKTSEESLARAQHVARLGSWELDVKTRAAHFSDELVKIFALEPGNDPQSLDRLIERAIPPDRPKLRDLVEQAIAEHAPKILDHKIHLPNGTERSIRQRIEMVDGHIFGTAQDITDLRQVQEALVASEERFRTMAENMPGAVYEFRLFPDESRRFEYISLGVEELTGLDRDAIARDPEIWTNLIHADDIGGFKDSLERSRRDLSLWSWQGRNVLRDGREKWVRGIAVPRMLEDDSIVWSGFTFDITEARRLQEQLRQSQKMEAVGQLTGGIAHDYNNLMAVMLGNAEQLLNEVDTPDHRAMLEAIVDAVRRGGDLTARLLAFSRNQTVATERVNVSELCMNLSEMLERPLGETIRIEMDVEDGLFADIDPTHLETSILNLALNARDAMDQGGTLRIELRGASIGEDDLTGLCDGFEVNPGPFVVLRAVDTGHGIPAELEDRVFEPFFTTKEIGRGSGLGLAMVHSFAVRSKGFVRLERNDPNGTTIVLALPRAEAPETAQASKSPAPEAETPDTEEAHTVLVVEDEPGLLKLFVQLLEQEGFRTLPASDAEAALRLAMDAAEFDLLLSDIVLPGRLNGFELCQSLRTTRPNLPAVFVSGYSTPEHGEVPEDAVLLRKPFSRATLVNAIETLQPEMSSQGAA